MSRRLGLAEAVQALRRELAESIEAGADEDLLFEVGEIELQLQVELTSEAEAKGGIKAWIIEATIGSKESVTNTHVVRIPLTPIDSDGNRVLTRRVARTRPK